MKKQILGVIGGLGPGATAYFMHEMNCRKRQVLCNLNGNSVKVQAGAMQWMVGNVNATTGLKGVGDLFGKALRGSVTGESAIKPEYTGDGTLVLERAMQEAENYIAERKKYNQDTAQINDDITQEDMNYREITKEYNRQKVVEYAAKWAYKRNPRYYKCS